MQKVEVIGTPKKYITTQQHTLHAQIDFWGVVRLDLSSVVDLKIPFTLATDGLSSNYSLNIFDELRVALFMHYESDLNYLAKLSELDSVNYKSSQDILT